MHRKGQWFIIAGLILISMIALVMSSKTIIQIGPGIEPWQKYIFENVRLQNAYAINTILQENATSKNIEARSRDYLDFLENFGDSHGVNISSYFIIGLPSGDNLNVSIINFERRSIQNISITVGSSTQTIPLMSDRNSTTLVFSSVPDYFTVSYTLSEINSTGDTETENHAITTTKRVFSATKTRIDSKDGNQVWQKVEWD